LTHCFFFFFFFFYRKPRDVTPEAVAALIERPAPGLVHLLLTAGLESTPHAALGRPVAGLHGSSVLVTLPGSPKGAAESVDTLARVIPHALKQAAGASGKDNHKLE
jgi:gephyrin